MHPDPGFRAPGPDRNLSFARQRGFGTLAVNGPGGPLLCHVPFHLTAEGDSAEMHLVRSNEIARHLEAALPAVIAVAGPDGYISPDWYGLPDQVPTWNYVAVHLRGRLERLPDDALRGILDKVSDGFEARLAPKPPWRTEKMPADLMARLMRALVPCRLVIETVDGTWKLNQNKPDAARLGAADAVGQSGAGQNLADLAALMRDPPS